MLAYIMITDGELRVIPIDIDLPKFTHVTVNNRRLSRSLLMKHVSYCLFKDLEVPVFMISEDDFNNTVQSK